MLETTEQEWQERLMAALDAATPEDRVAAFRQCPFITTLPEGVHLTEVMKDVCTD